MAYLNLGMRVAMSMQEVREHFLVVTNPSGVHSPTIPYDFSEDLTVIANALLYEGVAALKPISEQQNTVWTKHVLALKFSLAEMKTMEAEGQMEKHLSKLEGMFESLEEDLKAYEEEENLHYYEQRRSGLSPVLGRRIQDTASSHRVITPTIPEARALLHRLNKTIEEATKARKGALDFNLEAFHVMIVSTPDLLSNLNLQAQAKKNILNAALLKALGVIDLEKRVEQINVLLEMMGNISDHVKLERLEKALCIGIIESNHKNPELFAKNVKILMVRIRVLNPNFETSALAIKVMELNKSYWAAVVGAYSLAMEKLAKKIVELAADVVTLINDHKI